MTAPAHARYEIVRDDFWAKDHLVIRDLGPWDEYSTVTNAAEAIVDGLVAAGRLPEGRRLFYYDSEGRLDEILIKGGRFAGFHAGAGR